MNTALLCFVILTILLIVFLIYTHRVLGGENLARYDAQYGPDTPATFTSSESPIVIEKLNAYLRESFGMSGQSAAASTGWASKRELFDAAGMPRDFSCEFRADSYSYNGIELDGVWTLVKGEP